MTQNPNPMGLSMMVNGAEVASSSRKDGTGFEGMSLQVEKLNLRPARSGATGISGFSIAIPNNELVVLFGADRGEVTALLEALAGFDQDAARQVEINEVKLSENPKAFRPYIGFVPAEDGLHADLTVLEILQYEEVLRMPRGLQEAALSRRLGELLEMTGLTPLAGRRFGTLDGLEKRLVSIAVALINQPRLLFVDLPKGPLGPGGEARITTLLCEQARRGCTVVQAAETARCAPLADKVILLAADGTLAWYGPAEEALPWFQSQANPGDRAAHAFQFDDVLDAVRYPPAEKNETWFERYKAQPAYQKYIDDPLNGRLPDLYLQNRPLARFRGLKNVALPPPIRQVSGILKLNLLVDRGVRLLFRDRTALFMLAAVPLIGLSDLLLSSPGMNDPLTGYAGRVPVVLGLNVFLAMLLAAMLFRSEIIKERDVVRREQRNSALALAYILSKLWIVGFYALYQGLVWAVIHSFATAMQGGMSALLGYWVTLSLVSLIGGLIGLIASAVSRSPQAVPVWVLAMIVPQLILSGSIVPLPNLTPPARILSWANPSRYAFETLVTASGCGQLTEAQRAALTAAQNQNCGTGTAFQGNLLHGWLSLLGMSIILIILLIWIQNGISI